MRDNSNLLILNGMHTSGKSTVGSFLEDQGYHFLPETAQKLINEEGYNPGKDSGKSFQKAVFQHESQRDRSLIKQGNDAVIETWHIGNIAHAEIVADQDLVEHQKEYLETFKDETDFSIRAIYLDIPTNEILERSNTYDEEDEDVRDFYEEVGLRIRELYDEFDIEYFEVQNHNGSLQETKEDVIDIVDGFTTLEDQTYNISPSISEYV